MSKLFEIISPFNDRFNWSEHLPEKTQFLAFPNTKSMMVSGNWGQMLFQIIKKDEFSIWITQYYAEANRVFTIRSESEVIKFTMLIQNNLPQTVSPFHNRMTKESQFNIYFVPYLEKSVSFKENESYATLDIQFSVSDLEKLLPYFKIAIEPFLKYITKGRPSQLFPANFFASHYMLDIARQIIRELQSPDRNELIIELNVKLLLAYAFSYSVHLKSEKNLISAHQISEINRVSSLILENLFDPPSIKNLAKETGTSVTAFKRNFKMVLKEPPYQYWSTYRMNLAFEKIVSSEDSITDIALGLGFSTVTNFSKAFKKKFKLSPTIFRK